MMIPNPAFLYVAGGALLLGATGGYKVRDWRCDAALANALEQAAKRQQEAQDEVDQQAATYEEVRTATYDTGAAVEREVRLVYREVPAPSVACEPDVRVIGLLQEHLDSANASASGEPSE
jgi:hypothetical protein